MYNLTLGVNAKFNFDYTHRSSCDEALGRRSEVLHSLSLSPSAGFFFRVPDIKKSS